MKQIKVKKYKISRKVGVPLFEKCQTQTYALREKRREGRLQQRFKVKSEYAKQLIEKQKVSYLYGVTDTWIKTRVQESQSLPGSKREGFLVNKLERRLDNIAYRLALAPTRRMARQMVSHGHILVNGKKMRSPSYTVKDSDTVTIRKGSERAGFFLDLKEKMDARAKTSWVKWNMDKKEGMIIGNPEIERDIFSISDVFGYYSR